MISNLPLTPDQITTLFWVFDRFLFLLLLLLLKTMDIEHVRIKGEPIMKQFSLHLPSKQTFFYIGPRKH